MTKYYSVKVSPTRYINWCDECWYETCDYDNRHFTLEEAQTIVQQMRKHFQYHVSIIGEGVEMKYEFGKLVTPDTAESLHAAVENQILNKAEGQDFELDLF